MTEERKHDLAFAYNTLVAHNLWRRGKSDKYEINPKEIGEAIDTAAGAILDYLMQDGETETLRQRLKSAESALAGKEETIRELDATVTQQAKEIQRLKQILTAHGIPFNRKKK